MNNKILLIGNFADNISKPGGQHIRSSMIKKLMYSTYQKATFQEIDLKENKVKCIWAIINQAFRNNKIIAIMASRSTLLISSILFFIGCINKVEYVAVGGWLPSYLKKHAFLCYILKKMKIIFVQTPPMYDDLKKMGFQNISVLPNFRDVSDFERIQKTESVYKFVFCARITKEKGAALAIHAINEARKILNRNLELVFYGPIQDDFKDEFMQLISNHDFCKFEGYLDNSSVIQTLRQYDCMILPTYYPGEGFPGSILEAFMSGLPVVASDWNYNKEYVFDGVNGFLCKPNDVNDLIRCVISISKLDADELDLLSENAYREGQKFSFDCAKKIYVDTITKIEMDV